MIIKTPPAACWEVYPDQRTFCLNHTSRTIFTTRHAGVNNSI